MAQRQQNGNVTRGQLAEERRCEETSKKYWESQNLNAAALHQWRSSTQITARPTHKQTRMEDTQKQPITIWQHILQDFSERHYDTAREKH